LTSPGQSVYVSHRCEVSCGIFVLPAPEASLPFNQRRSAVKSSRLGRAARCLIVATVSAVSIGVAGPVAVGSNVAQAAPSTRDLAVVSVSVSPRVAPGGSFAVTVTAKNTGSTVWSASSVKLVYVGVGTWTGSTLTLAANTKKNVIGTFKGTLGASTQIGLYSLAWQAVDGGASFAPAIVARKGITCSDGVFCNGDERYVNGRCVAGPPTCDDGQPCTIDRCDEPTKRCDHTLSGSSSCAVCAMKNCNPNCHGAVCGDDGCGGSCGPCEPGQACADGVCVVASDPGTCIDPLPLAGTDPDAPLPAGLYFTAGDNTDGFDEVIPPCRSVRVKELSFEPLVDLHQFLAGEAALPLYRFTPALTG
jgi:hypothetical protein